MDHETLLSDLGLTEKEARIYLALLKMGEGAVQDIAKEAGVKRPTAYVVLDELRKKEAVLKVPQAKRTIYIAKSPSELYEQHIQKLSRVAQVLPLLEALHKKDKRVNMLYFEGVKGIEESLYYRHKELAHTQIDGFWAKVDTWDAKTKKIIDTWGKKTAATGVTVRAIAPDHPSLDEYRKKDAVLNWHIKTVPEKQYSSNTSIEVTDFFVRITEFDTPQAIIIESPEFVKTVREIFEMVWEKKRS